MAGWVDNLPEIQNEIRSSEIEEIVYLYGDYLQGEHVETVEELVDAITKDDERKELFQCILRNIGGEVFRKKVSQYLSHYSREALCHNNGFCGFELFAHIRNPDEVYENIEKLHENIADNKVRVVLGTDKSVRCNAREFTDLCYEHFETHYERLAHFEPIVLPPGTPSRLKGIVETMKSWCNETNYSPNMKGLVIHSFRILEYLKWFNNKFTKTTLDNNLYIDHFPRMPVIIVYNPKENVIFLIRKAESENLESEIDLCCSDLKMFMLLVFNELKHSGMKVIPLVAIEKEEYSKLRCGPCTNCIVTTEMLECPDLFKIWYDERSEYFEIKNTMEIDRIKVTKFSAKLIGLLAAVQIHDQMPTFTKDPDKQIEGALLMLTPEQKSIIYSDCKHMILKGPYGSGKSIIARLKLKMMSECLKENEMLYLICYDSKSDLLNELHSNSRVKLYRNEEGLKLSEIMKAILRKVNKRTKVHIITDEYDGEDLDEMEAQTINKMLEEAFRDTFVLLIAQSMQKERSTDNIPQAKNKFDLLRTMKMEELTLVLRNSIEINNLVRATENFLEGQTTVYQQPGDANSGVKLTTPRSDVTKTNEKNTNRNQIKDKQSNVSNPHANQANRARAHPSLKITSDIAKLGNRTVGKLGLDEAFGVAETLRGNYVIKNEIVNRFTYETAEDTGHKISSEKPKLFEVCDNQIEFLKLSSLRVIFQNLNVPNSNRYNKHVVLHFYTINDEIPKFFKRVFESLGMCGKVTSYYQEFRNNNNGKHILVCSFRKFRGLEHPAVTVVIDHDIYSLQHYIVETIARCTTRLAVVILDKCDAVMKITEKWKGSLDGRPVVEQWKIETKIEKKKRKNSFQINEDLKLITVYIFSKELDEYRNQKNGEEDLKCMMKEEAVETIRKSFTLGNKDLVSEKQDASQNGTTAVIAKVKSSDNQQDRNNLHQIMDYSSNVQGDKQYVQDFVNAARDGYLKRVKKFLNKGLSPDVQKANGWTPLHGAAMYDEKECMKVLLFHGSIVNKRDKYGDTPLHIAVFYDSLSAIGLLLQNGADLNIKNKSNQTALDKARFWNRKDIIQLLT